ncbi:TolC family protein [Singulisphaera sp. PoT]|uniref:TolC family protein n=1 Tax=Singulisphaera sp. PoT TaxID=3411797 RepID=UPI003BF54228
MRPRIAPCRPTGRRRWVWPLGLAFAMGCGHDRPGLRESLASRIEPTTALATAPIPRPAGAGTPADPMLARANATREVEGPPALPDRPVAIESPPPQDVAELDAIATSGRPIDLGEAIGLAFRLQPRLRAQLESIAQARGRQEVAASTFLPTAGGSYSVGGFDLGVGGQPIRIGNDATSGFNFVPGLGAVPVGLHLASGYELAEFKVQWLVCDFGRRLGRYEQAKLALDVSRLQTERAFQTVANEVSLAYYGVLRSQAMRRTARDASLRAEEELADARKLQREGVIPREAVLRAEVLQAETRQQWHAATEAEFVALAELNLAIGLKCNEPVRVVEPPDPPAFGASLGECLEAAVRRRREFRVAQRSVEIAHEGTRVAKAEFAPRIVSEGVLTNLQQSSPTGYADLALGFIRLEWNIFEGGRRVAESKVADSRVREAMAQAESIADNIAFQVNESYRRLATARLGIDDARPAVEQAAENYRLVRLRVGEGNATPTEISDAQASLTRAQQNFLNSKYAYLTAIVRLDYATGNSPTPTTPANGNL